MSCPKCSFSFNKDRKPLVLACGHSFCSECLKIGEEVKCRLCGNQSKPVINFALYEQVAKKNLSNIDKYIKICLFGNMNVGKSSILRRLIDNEFEYQTNPTIGIDFKYVDKEVDGKMYRFQIWDSAGQERYRSMSSHHLKGTFVLYLGSDIILLVYDVSRGYYENGLTYWIGEIENYAKHGNIVIVGNKTDLITNEKTEETNSINKVSKLPPMLSAEVKAIESFGWEQVKVSCLANENIEELWRSIIKRSKISQGTTAEEKRKSVLLQESSIGKSNVKIKGKISSSERCC